MLPPFRTQGKGGKGGGGIISFFPYNIEMLVLCCFLAYKCSIQYMLLCTYSFI